MSEENNGGAAPETGGGAQAQQPRVRFDTSQLKSSYCNVCNATSNREEVVLNFGINQNWEMSRQEVDVQLQHRIIVSPHAAKRLSDLLQKILAEHESRFGKLD